MQVSDLDHEGPCGAAAVGTGAPAESVLPAGACLDAGAPNCDGATAGSWHGDAADTAAPIAVAKEATVGDEVPRRGSATRLVGAPRCCNVSAVTISAAP